MSLAHLEALSVATFAIVSMAQQHEPYSKARCTLESAAIHLTEVAAMIQAQIEGTDDADA